MVDILASATVFARVVLPKGIDIEVSSSLILVVVIRSTTIPTSLGADAFPKPNTRASVRTHYAKNMAERYESSGDERSVYVRANLVNVPLEVLPGRQNELRCHLRDEEPVKAGIQGVAAVGITVPGLTGTSRQPRVEGANSS
ncbi:hypothetical protein M422DRAFT_265128 [Sphaerobolus stellatus SS14]|uniref:Unplaced genomic scaffold SPHSTscaffold_144, whole genome shotgun sequence n=1 Tax=Sphaerobolus stellatus (strain SS14) TaxID=990650 RepID=A0A0C9TUS5_SPHS4|nr:hypothetical protein M422DRAFT_273458 [Sphaerobolus stellatus SS14]KIJ32946.1 hypothetical protein M422DRAFT_265128 [Sphaerobolus stellatus SS14]